MQTKFVICISDEGHEDLSAWKIYRVLPDPKGDEAGCLRIIDDSNEDYLYPESRFISVEFPEDIRDRLLATSI